MTTKDLLSKHGGTNAKQAIQRAIRAELAGGNEALDGLERLHQLTRETGSAEAAEGLDALQQVAGAMRAEIRRRYGLPAE